jgi:transcriptional regulator
MYQPAHHIESRPEVLQELICAHPLGLLIANSPEGPVANPVPFLFDADKGPRGQLTCHVARANGQWKLIQDQPETPVLVVFQGPQAYVTPSWYAAKAEHGKVVPTWNYCIVQARGTASVHEDPAWLRAQVQALTGRHEEGRQTPWAVTDAPERFVETMLRGIVGIEIDILDLAGKWKVSQNRSAADRAGVKQGLEDDGNEAMAALIDSTG